jgi:plastocyanin
MDSAPDTVTSDSGSELDSETLGREGTYSHRFDQGGNFSYYCTIHPSMKLRCQGRLKEVGS